MGRRTRVFTHICEHCKREFQNFDVKGRICKICQSKDRFCECGCGVKLKSIYSQFAPGHNGKGKSYREIYGDVSPNCGFKKGLENPNFNKTSKDKANTSLKNFYKQNPDLLALKIMKGQETILKKGVSKYRFKYSNDRGEKFRSKLELNFANLLQKNNISYKTEQPIKMINGKLKIVDFVIDNEIFVEITGYAYESWKIDFDQKINLLRQTIDNPIILITYKNTQEELAYNNWHIDVETVSFEEEENILGSIYFNQRLLKIQKIADDISVN